MSAGSIAPGPALVIMAAGLGSRYGGDKQIDAVGPAGEALLEYGVYDALRAGFSRIVFVIRDSLAEPMQTLASRFDPRLEVAFAVQRHDDLPAGFSPPARTKPWGTAHAVLAARHAVSAPFAVVNADDFYGAETYRLAADCCDRAARTGAFAIVGLRLDRTLSDHGPVIRGIPRTEAGRLTGLDEVRGIQRAGATITGEVNGVSRTLTGAEIASMNCWVFTPAIFPALGGLFEQFLRESGHDPRAELALPEAVNDLVLRGRATVDVIESPGPWFGMTHREDREMAREGVQALVDAGDYPSPLWED